MVDSINIKGKDLKLKFTFNSFNYMEDFNIKDFEEMEDKPFKLVPILTMLLMGALNHNPKIKISMEIVQDFLEEYVVENDLNELLDNLIVLLQDSNFFKSLQKN